MFLSPPAISKAATATLTIAELLAFKVIVTGTVAVSLTLPTGALCDAGIASGNMDVNLGLRWSLINTGTLAALTTLVAWAGHTIVGGATVGIGASGFFETAKTGANTFVTYRRA